MELENKPRKPGLAGVLTFFSIGLGHLYCGDIKKGVILFFGGQLLYVLAYLSLLFYVPAGPIIAILAIISYLAYCIFDSIKGSKPYGRSYPMKKYNRWYIYLLYWLVATFIIQSGVQAAVKRNIVQTYKIPSGAMIQTIQIGDHIISNKLIYKTSEPQRGDVVIFPLPEDPSKDFIKRIVALGGETLAIIDKKVYIDGNLLNEPYVIHTDEKIIPADIQPRDNFGPIKIPDNAVFVMGDNRDSSYDSRFWGFVDKSAITGKAVVIYWSWDEENFRVRWERIGRKIV